MVSYDWEDGPEYQDLLKTRCRICGEKFNNGSILKVGNRSNVCLSYMDKILDRVLNTIEGETYEKHIR